MFCYKRKNTLIKRAQEEWKPQKVTGSLEVTVTYFMTPKVMMTFVVGLTQFMTPRGHWLTTGQLDLLKKKLKKN